MQLQPKSLKKRRIESNDIDIKCLFKLWCPYSVIQESKTYVFVVSCKIRLVTVI